MDDYLMAVGAAEDGADDGWDVRAFCAAKVAEKVLIATKCQLASTALSFTMVQPSGWHTVGSVCVV